MMSSKAANVFSGGSKTQSSARDNTFEANQSGKRFEEKDFVGNWAVGSGKFCPPPKKGGKNRE